MEKVQKFFEQFRNWATKEENILGVVFVGSHARDAAKEDSDIDLIIITKDTNIYLDDNSWIEQFGKIKVDGIQDEEWGIVKTRRVFYKNGIEAEFNFSTEEWTKTNPIDEGTKKVMMEGNKILLDKRGLFKNLVEKLHNVSLD